jgi:hypothetical protein
VSEASFKDYPAPFPRALRRLGFKDESWHNDARGRAVKNVSGGRVAVVWCGEVEPRRREFGPESKRFLGYVCPGREGGEIDDNEAADEFEVETERELATAAARLLRAHGGGGRRR